MSERTLALPETRGDRVAARVAQAFIRDGGDPAPPPARLPERILAIVAILALVLINVVGFFAALTLIAASLLLLALRPGDSARTLLRFSPLLALPLLAAVSTLWSDAPAESLKLGLEIILTVVAGILLCRNTSPRTLLLVMFLGLLPICLATLSSVPRALQTGWPMKAFFGSKNELGMMAQLLFALSLAIILDREHKAVLRLVGVGALALAVGLLYMSQSATAQVCAGITAILFPFLLVFGRFPLAFRIGSLVVLLAALGLALPFIGTITAEIEEFRGSVLNKDATLTGRTYLWEVADKISADHPWLGTGYGAFWRPGNIEAEALWRWGAVVNKSGFNFHNAFVEIRVALGAFGVVLLALTCAVVLLAGIARQVWRPSVPIAFFVTMNLVLYIRSYSEAGLFAPFSFQTVLWLGGAVYVMSEAGKSAVARPKAVPAPIRTPRTGPGSRRMPGMTQPRRLGPTGRRA